MRYEYKQIPTTQEQPPLVVVLWDCSDLSGTSFLTVTGKAKKALTIEPTWQRVIRDRQTSPISGTNN
eukprot:scaffold766_cov179-Amphora_coffeaeformis.AAC.20